MAVLQKVAQKPKSARPAGRRVATSGGRGRAEAQSGDSRRMAGLIVPRRGMAGAPTIPCNRAVMQPARGPSDRTRDGPEEELTLRAGLALTATGVLGLVALRQFLPEFSRQADVALAVGAALALVLLASLARPPRVALAAALAVTVVTYLYTTQLLGRLPVGVALAIALLLLYRWAPFAHRPLLVGGFALWTPSLRLVSLGEPLAIIALAALAFLMVSCIRPHDDDALRRIGLAVVAIAIVAAVFLRHEVLASSAFAPDEAVALASVAGLLILASVRSSEPWRSRVAGAMVLLAFAAAAAVFVIGSRYHVDAVVSPHRSAELLLSGKNPYIGLDMGEALERFGLPRTLATRREDGTFMTTLNYPAGSFVFLVPFVWLGVADTRWVFLIVLLAALALVNLRMRGPWSLFASAALIGNALVLRQHVLAGLDPVWLLGVVAAWLFYAHRRLSPIALGLAAATRQLAWFFVPF